MLCDPVLAFVKSFRLKGSTDSLRHAALSKFDSVLLGQAIKALWDSDCSGKLSEAGLSFHPRRDSGKRSQSSAILDDILLAFDKLDENNNIPDIFCEAADLIKLPPISMDSCTSLIQQNTASLDDMKGKIDALSSDVAALASKLAESQHHQSSTSSQGDTPITPSYSPPHKTSQVFPRHENLIIFGLEEQSITATMESVKNMLQFVVGRSAPVKDLFRIGKRKKSEDDLMSPSRPRPVVLKLMSAWDRRLVLANRFALKNYSVKGIFIREDLSPEERKLREQQRLKRRTENSLDNARTTHHS